MCSAWICLRLERPRNILRVVTVVLFAVLCMDLLETREHAREAASRSARGGEDLQPAAGLQLAQPLLRAGQVHLVGQHRRRPVAQPRLIKCC